MTEIIEIGKAHALHVRKQVDFGFYLDAGDLGPSLDAGVPLVSTYISASDLI